MLQERPDADPVYVPVPNDPDSVVVAMVVARVADVPYANPRVVAFEPFVAVMSPLSVAVVAVMDEAAEVVMDGAAAPDAVVKVRSLDVA